MAQRHEAPAPSSAVDVGVDVGGTFTDFVGFRGRDVVSLKLPSTRDPSETVVEGLRALGAARMAHGTTVATNAILERKGARTAFVTTEGFEHLLLIGRQNRPSLYDLRITRPDPPIPRERCFGLRERVDARGRVLRSPTKRDLAEVVRKVRSSGSESVAISLLFSFLHPAHEQRLAQALSGLSVSTSHEVLAEFREFERSSTTALDAYVTPLVIRYLQALDRVGRGGRRQHRLGGCGPRAPGRPAQCRSRARPHRVWKRRRIADGLRRGFGGRVPRAELAWRPPAVACGPRGEGSRPPRGRVAPFSGGNGPRSAAGRARDHGEGNANHLGSAWTGPAGLCALGLRRGWSDARLGARKGAANSARVGPPPSGGLLRVRHPDLAGPAGI